MAEEWVRSNFSIDPEYDAIEWGNGQYTTVTSFLNMFGEVINSAIENDSDPKQAIIESDPEDEKGFHSLIN